MKRNNSLVKGSKIVFRTIGFCITLGCVFALLIIFFGIFINEGIILYEFNKAIIVFEIMLVLFSVIYLVYIFRERFWKK